MVVIAVMGVVIRQVVLQAGARGGRVTAAERNAIQQVTAVHITPDTAGNRGGGGRRCLYMSEVMHKEVVFRQVKNSDL